MLINVLGWSTPTGHTKICMHPLRKWVKTLASIALADQLFLAATALKVAAGQLWLGPGKNRDPQAKLAGLDLQEPQSPGPSCKAPCQAGWLGLASSELTLDGHLSTPPPGMFNRPQWVYSHQDFKPAWPGFSCLPTHQAGHSLNGDQSCWWRPGRSSRRPGLGWQYPRPLVHVPPWVHIPLIDNHWCRKNKS